MLNIMLIPATVYLLITAVCITNRMNKHTKLRTRLSVIGIGGIAMWSLERIAGQEWMCTPVNLSYAGIIIAISIIMWQKYPRVAV